jgi:hypothetical protein
VSSGGGGGTRTPVGGLASMLVNIPEGQTTFSVEQRWA